MLDEETDDGAAAWLTSPQVSDHNAIWERLFQD